LRLQLEHKDIPVLEHGLANASPILADAHGQVLFEQRVATCEALSFKPLMKDNIVNPAIH
jgi:hypothetical protein